jgi:hypothetical protein
MEGMSFDTRSIFSAKGRSLRIPLEWLLLILLPAFLTGTGGCASRDPSLVENQREISKWMHIANIDGRFDNPTLVYVRELFRKRGIPAKLEGSVGSGVFVPQSHAERALSILREDQNIPERSRLEINERPIDLASPLSSSPKWLPANER